ncbi:MAG: hypothetical protein H7123_04705 [Thermoleophilia bacterium]|nr:hypothetical protein [Thermoleophilia bacterium]
MKHFLLRTYRRSSSAEQGSAAVEYVGLAMVVSMLMAATARVIDTSLGTQFAAAVVQRLVDVVRHVS